MRDQSSKNAVRAVLFDLDGTLLDTAPDMVAALNELRRQESLAPLAFADVKPYVSFGAARLIGLAFPAASPALLWLLRSRFLALYAEGLLVHTRLFPGMSGLLTFLEQSRIPWGVVTDKPRRFTGPLLDGLGLAQRAGVVVSGGSIPERKPHPAPLLHAARQLRVAPEHCLYVGAQSAMYLLRGLRACLC